MSESQTATESERLRAFVKRMHDEGAAGFADGPSPWETWDDDESGVKVKKRIWEGKSKRIYPKQHSQQSLGDRVLSGLAMLSLATMVVGIAGVYFSDPQPRQVAATGIQPLPVDRPPQGTDNIVTSLEQLPVTTAGTSVSGIDRNNTAPLAAVSLPDRPAPNGDTAMQAPALPAAAAASPATNDAGPVDDLAMRPAATGEPVVTLTDTSNLEGVSGIDAASAAPQLIATGSTDHPPAPAASDIHFEPLRSPTILTPAPVTVTVTVTTGTAENAAAEALADTVPDTAAASGDQTILPALPAEPADRSQPNTAAGTGIATTVVTPDESIAADISSTETTGDVADTVASLEALPVPTAGPAPIAEVNPADSSAIPPPATGTIIAVAEPAPRTAATAPAKAVEPTAASKKSGDWVVNLASYTRKSTANRMLSKFQDKGVDAELVTVTINDRPMHRVRVTGFASSRTAKASIGSLEQQLGLEGVWISRE